MAGSVTTTRISLLEIGTDQNYVDEGTLFIPSGSTIEHEGEMVGAGGFDLSGSLDIADGTLLPGVSTGTAGVDLLADGQLSIVSHSAASAWLVYRSGATVYTWQSTDTAG